MVTVENRLGTAKNQARQDYLSAVGSRNHNSVWVDLRDTEVAAEMDQVERAQLAGDLNDAHVVWGAGENGNASDVWAGEVQPEVGDSGVGLGSIGGRLVGVDQVFPTCCVEAIDDGGHGL